MRFSAFIVACALCTACEAGLRFTEPVWRPDLGFSVPCLEGAKGVPFDLPSATSYLVTRDGATFLEDRFDSFDLWSCHVLRGRWRDAAGNELQIARLASLPPDDDAGTVRTRRSFYTELARRTFDRKDVGARDTAAGLASAVELGRAVRPRRGMRRNLSALVFYATTNENAVVCAFRPRSPEPGESPDWFMASIVTALGTDMAEVRARFDDEFLDRISVPPLRARDALPQSKPPPCADAAEEDLLRYDVGAQVVNLDDWHLTVADGLVVIDDLTAGVHRDFVGKLTNGLPRFRRAYAASVPSPLVGTNALAVVRVFESREEYLAYVGEDRAWTAAVWSPRRRELVLHYSAEGTQALLRTVWHEAFHQYLAYAGALAESAPWFNEGHAELFEQAELLPDGTLRFERDPAAATYVQEYAVQLAEALPAVLEMDYEAFYAGAPKEIEAKYHLAWSIAYFLEVGAPKLRFRPYESLRADYMESLVETRSMSEATAHVLGEKKSRDEFVAAWLAFWRRQ